MGDEREKVGDSGFCVRSNLTAHVSQSLAIYIGAMQ